MVRQYQWRRDRGSTDQCTSARLGIHDGEHRPFLQQVAAEADGGRYSCGEACGYTGVVIEATRRLER